MCACLATRFPVGEQKSSIAGVGITCQSLGATSCFTTRRIEVPTSFMRAIATVVEAFATVAQALAGREPFRS